jgi:hypothetical protein
MNNIKNIFFSLALVAAFSVVGTQALSAIITSENAKETVELISMHFQFGDNLGFIKGKYGEAFGKCRSAVTTALSNNMAVDPEILKKLTTIYNHIFNDQKKKNSLIERKNNNRVENVKNQPQENVVQEQDPVVVEVPVVVEIPNVVIDQQEDLQSVNEGVLNEDEQPDFLEIEMSVSEEGDVENVQRELVLCDNNQQNEVPAQENEDVVGIDFGASVEENHEKEAPVVNELVLNNPVQELGLPSLTRGQKAYRRKVRAERQITAARECITEKVTEAPNDPNGDDEDNSSDDNNENNEQLWQTSVFKMIVQLDVILKQNIQWISLALKKYGNRCDKDHIKEKLQDLRLKELNEMLQVLETLKIIVLKETFQKTEKEDDSCFLRNILSRYSHAGEVKQYRVCSGTRAIKNFIMSLNPFQKTLNAEELKELNELNFQAQKITKNSLNFFTEIVKKLELMN